MQFTEITEKDFSLIDMYFVNARNNERETRVCDYAPGTVKMWHDVYDMRFAEAGGCLIISAVFEEGVPCFMVPVGRDISTGLSALRDEMRDGGTIAVIPTDDIPAVTEMFGARLETEFSCERDWADYIYMKRDFESPAGKKHHAQKNHINRFAKEHPEAVFVPVTDENKEDAIEYLTDYCRRNPESSDIEGDEYRVTRRALENLGLYGMRAGLLYSEKGEDPSKICGITVGEVFKDTVYVHVEKAEKEMTGAFQTLSSLFMKSITDEACLYVNREEDMGLPGLRHSKTSYVPLRLDDKYTVRVGAENDKFRKNY